METGGKKWPQAGPEHCNKPIMRVLRLRRQESGYSAAVCLIEIIGRNEEAGLQASPSFSLILLWHFKTAS